MVKVGKKVLEKIVGMAVCKNRELKSWSVIEEGNMGIVKMLSGTVREVKQRNEFSMKIAWVAVCTSRPIIFWRIQHTLFWKLNCCWPCCPTLKERRLLKTQLLDGYVLHQRKVLWSACSIIINFIELSWHMLFYIQYLWSVVE